DDGGNNNSTPAPAATAASPAASAAATTIGGASTIFPIFVGGCSCHATIATQVATIAVCAILRRTASGTTTAAT
ncbi:hypothetical protein, partial [Streptomyces sp. 1222.5]|uniref:hypothetical protein n=1 Tax=Streptomyces sp. 1222.5 TaxID=1881026 RepID=UPI003EB85A11